MALLKLTNPEELARIMKEADFSGARLGRAVGCSRSTINRLVLGQTATCDIVFATRIEVALSVRPGFLFAPVDEPARRRRVARQAKAAA